MARQDELTLTRRAFLRRAALTSAGAALLAACAPSGPPAAPTKPTEAPKAAESKPAATTAPAKPAETAKPAAETKPAAPAGAGRLVVGIGSLPNTPDPHLDSTANALIGYALLFEKLVGVDDKGSPTPALAESFRNVDPLTWEFKLRPNVQFHNGEPLTADAVKFSIERVLNPETKSPWAGRIAAVDEVQVVDPLSFRITTKQPFSPLLQGLTVVDILPPRYFQDKGAQAFAEAPVGTGPFAFKSWVKQDNLTVTASAGHWRGRPKLDEVVLRSVPEASTRVSAIEAGDLDASLLLPPEQIDRLKGRGLDVQTVVQGQGMVVNFRSTVPGPLQDRRVRLAINLAVDREAIFQSILLGQGRILDGQVVGPEAFGYNPNLKPYPYDPDQAKALLKDAGFGDGFSVKFHGSQGRYTKDKEIQEAIVGQLSEVGIDAQLEILEAGVFIQSFLSAQIGPMWIWAWQYLPAMDADLPLNFFQSGSVAKFYANPEFDAVIARSRQALDPAERSRLLQQASQIAYDDASTLFLFQTPGIYATKKSVQGLTWRPDYLIDFKDVTITR